MGQCASSSASDHVVVVPSSIEIALQDKANDNKAAQEKKKDPLAPTVLRESVTASTDVADGSEDTQTAPDDPKLDLLQDDGYDNFQDDTETSIACKPQPFAARRFRRYTSKTHEDSFEDSFFVDSIDSSWGQMNTSGMSSVASDGTTSHNNSSSYVNHCRRRSSVDQYSWGQMNTSVLHHKSSASADTMDASSMSFSGRIPMDDSSKSRSSNHDMSMSSWSEMNTSLDSASSGPSHRRLRYSGPSHHSSNGLLDPYASMNGSFTIQELENGSAAMMG